MYARPANSGPGRTFMMGLPYILGDKDPKDPVNGWDKTWAYLAGAQPGHRVLPDRHRRDDEGVRRGLARHHHLDHRLGHQSARPRHRAEGSARSGRSKGFHWVSDAFFMAVPKGVSDDKLAVLLDLMKPTS